MATSAEVRAKLVDALQLDLVGPLPDALEHATYSEEELPQRPSSWYLTGFLAPQRAPKSHRADDAEDESEEEARGGQEDDKQVDRAAARRAFFPASMGLSVLVAPGSAALLAEVRWGDYQRIEATGNWKRSPRTASLSVPLTAGEPHEHAVPESNGLKLVVSVRPAGSVDHLPPDTRAVSVFLVNDRDAVADEKRDEAFAFQAELRLNVQGGFVPRPDLRGGDDDHWDEQVSELQFRDAVEYAVGHNVSARAIVTDGRCKEVRSCWLPQAEVQKVVAAKLPGIELRMEELAKVESEAQLRALIGGILPAYAAWIASQPVAFENQRRSRTAEQLLQNARRAHARIEAGLASLHDPLALEAFRVANRAVATAMRQRGVHDTEKDPAQQPAPSWHPFQLAFLLLNLPGMVDPSAADRRVVDLLFFPTGGGKTEAYLGLAAFTMVLRRLRDPSLRSSGLTVLMRYTLRLLTLDQLVRAATLVCALELERQQDVQKFGQWPFEIGLWVGLAATPNKMGKRGDQRDDTARARTMQYQRDDRRYPSPIPLEACPWCGWRFNKNCFALRPNADEPEELRVYCRHHGCAFHSSKQPAGIPVLAVDDQIYRRLPAFLIATVDKFASLPWEGRTGALFGRVDRADEKGFYGPCDQDRGAPLGGPLPPPELVIQDELHLISGPLGTMVGLYEAAIDELSKRGGGPGPKIVASTATVRRAARQIQALFGRSDVDIFPPPGPDRRDSFFAKTVPSTERHARLYLGVAAQGRNIKVVLLRTYLALLTAAQKSWVAEGGKRNKTNPADPYMTVLGYFNALRELGGARRLVEDEVQSRAGSYGARKRVGEAEGPFADRPQLRIDELTSRVSTSQVSGTRTQMGKPVSESDALDVVLASNMISVGLDVTRLGLMVVNGQPKTTAEYIQATSRVGRDEARPGLVVTLLNVHKPRDRSHYERFSAWHESFYRSVEVTSVTPFSPRAIDRGLAAVTVALARLGNSPLTAALAASKIADHRTAADRVAEVLSRRAEEHDKELSQADAEELRQKVRGRVVDLLDSWSQVADALPNLQYGREAGGPPLLRQPLDPDLDERTSHEQKFKASRSLRDVEPTVNLWLLKESAQ